MRIGLLALALLAGKAAPASAQLPVPDTELTHLEAGLANAALGALTASVNALLRGHDVLPALLGGAAGGTTVYLGKRLAMVHGPTAGLGGRQLAAVGASVVRNVGHGRPALSELVLPIWVARAYIRPGGLPTVKLDAASTLAALHFGFARRGRLDPRASFNTGALVFELPAGAVRMVDGRRAAGESAAGAIVVASLEDEGLLRHELAHVLQFDQAFVTLGADLEAQLATLHPGARRFHERVDLGLVGGAYLLGNAWIDYDDRPWEWEADLLAQRVVVVRTRGSGTSTPHALRR